MLFLSNNLIFIFIILEAAKVVLALRHVITFPNTNWEIQLLAIIIKPNMMTMFQSSKHN